MFQIIFSVLISPGSGALFSKTPVLTSKGSCFPESAGPGSTYVDPLNLDEMSVQIDSILNSDDKQREMISSGYEFVQKFHLENTSKNLFNFYSKVIN